jgi:hypothetical protein
MTTLLINGSLFLHANVNQNEATPTFRNWHIAEIRSAKLDAIKLSLANDQSGRSATVDFNPPTDGRFVPPVAHREGPVRANQTFTTTRTRS